MRGLIALRKQQKIIGQLVCQKEPRKKVEYRSSRVRINFKDWPHKVHMEDFGYNWIRL